MSASLQIHCLVSTLFLIALMHESHASQKRCPLWMEDIRLNTSESQCKCISFDAAIKCIGDHIALLKGYCLSGKETDDGDEWFGIALCPFGYYQLEYVDTLNTTITGNELNEVLCGPLNREGLFCSKCKPGYGIPVYSKVADECVKCGSKLTSWLLYLALELIPLTLFYLIVIIFNFSATQPPITAYIFYCQLFTQLSYNIPFVGHLFKVHTNNIFLYITLTACDIWNLDVLRYSIPSFCLSEYFKTAISWSLMDLVSVIYSMFLIVVTYSLIEMHASNCRIIVSMWRPFHKCFVFIRRTWDPRSSVVNAFATFLVLSSSKLSFIAYNLASTVRINYQTRNGSGMCTSRVLYVNPTVQLTENSNDVYHQPYFVPMLLLYIFFVLLPAFLLMLYPTRLSRKFTQCVCSGRVRTLLFLFMQIFQGYYKDGTTGTYDYRSASCIVFVLRFLVFVCLTNTHSRENTHNNGAITKIAFLLLAVSLFYALVQPYKKRYMNVIESLLYSSAAMLLIWIIHNNHFPPLFEIVMTVILTPSVVFAGVVMYRALKVLGIANKIKFISVKQLGGVGGGGDNQVVTDQEEPHRLASPTQYTPLIK